MISIFAFDKKNINFRSPHNSSIGLDKFSGS